MNYARRLKSPPWKCYFSMYFTFVIDLVSWECFCFPSSCRSRVMSILFNRQVGPDKMILMNLKGQYCMSHRILSMESLRKRKQDIWKRKYWDLCYKLFTLRRWTQIRARFWMAKTVNTATCRMQLLKRRQDRWGSKDRRMKRKASIIVINIRLVQMPRNLPIHRLRQYRIKRWLLNR